MPIPKQNSTADLNYVAGFFEEVCVCFKILIDRYSILI